MKCIDCNNLHIDVEYRILVAFLDVFLDALVQVFGVTDFGAGELPSIACREFHI